MNIIRVSPKNQDALTPGIVGLESHSTYPLGADSFTIDHGADYFAFFRRLGHLSYYVVQIEGQTAAVAGGILRKISFKQGESPKAAWYLCDLKVHPTYRGRKLPLKILRKKFFFNYLKAPRGYAISMNSADSKENRIVKLLSRFPWLSIKHSETLIIFSVSREEMIQIKPFLEASLGEISFISLSGKKDLILNSGNKAMELLHVQHGPGGENSVKEPQPGFTHMFCLPSKDPLNALLLSLGIKPSADASIISHGMAKSDWKFIMTSDI